MEQVPLERLEVEIATSCSFACSHCYITRARRRDARSVFTDHAFSRAAVEWAGAKGVLGLTVTGGEPTIQPSFRTMVDSCDECGVPLELYTNGAVGAGFWELPKVSRVVNAVEVSVYGFSAEEYGRLCGRPSAFRRMVDFVNRACTLGVSIVIKTSPAFFPKRESFDCLKAWARRLEVPILTFDLDVVPESYDPRVGPPTVVENRTADNSDLNHSLCEAGKTSLFISSTGEVRPCSLVASGIFVNASGDLDSAWSRIRQFVDRYHHLGRNPCRQGGCSGNSTTAVSQAGEQAVGDASGIAGERKE